MSDLILENSLEDVIYSILFVAGEGVDVNFIAEKLEVDIKKVNKAVDKLHQRLSGQSGVQLIKYNSKIQLCSNPDNAMYIETVLNPIRERALTKATLETLAIIAYKQPITRLEIEEVRGVNSDYTVQTLLDHNLIEVVGKKDAVGKPLLFGTTDEFLKRFGLSSLDELPNSEQLMERIAILYDEQTNTQSLYREYELPPEEDTKNELLERKAELTKLNEEVEEKVAGIDEKIQKALENISFKLPDKEEIPDFLKGEKVDEITAG